MQCTFDTILCKNRDIKTKKHRCCSHSGGLLLHLEASDQYTANHHQLCMGWEVHYLSAELLVFGSMQGLGEVITQHLVCWTVLDRDVPLLLLISNKEVSDVQVPGSFPSTLALILFQQHGTPIILVQYIVHQRVALLR